MKEKSKLIKTIPELKSKQQPVEDDLSPRTFFKVPKLPIPEKTVWRLR